MCSRPLPGDGTACAHDDSDSSATPTGTAPRTPGGGRRRSSGSATRGGSGVSGMARFLPGDVLAGRYRIVELLGRGGMGEVYRADDLKLGQPVALKFLPRDAAGRRDRLERFHAEVRMARQVSHPNVCRVYDIGEVDGQLFLSMEYVDGEDLASLLRRIGRLPPDKALEIARQICAGLAAAHESGVLHRDLKPANIMLDGRGPGAHHRLRPGRSRTGDRRRGAVAGRRPTWRPSSSRARGHRAQRHLLARPRALRAVHGPARVRGRARSRSCARSTRRSRRRALDGRRTASIRPSSA